MSTHMTKRNVYMLALAIMVLLISRNAIARLPACQLDYGSPFLNAVADRNIEEVDAFLKLKTNSTNSVTYRNYLLSRALSLAISAKSTACSEQRPDFALVRKLLSSGANVHAESALGYGNEERYNALHLAAVLGDSKTLSAVLDAGASIDHRTNWGRSALMLAVDAGNVSTTELLLKAGANPNMSSGSEDYANGITPLHSVARRSGSDNRIAKLLVAHGAKYQITEQGGPFFELAEFHSEPSGSIEELIDIFKSIGGNINEKGRWGKPLTPLNAGIRSNFATREVLEALLKKGADPNLGALYALERRSNNTDLPLTRKAVLELLVQYGARPELACVPKEFPGVFEFAEKNNPEYATELRDTFTKGNPGARRNCGKMWSAW
jgi:hypothetical protein